MPETVTVNKDLKIIEVYSCGHVQLDDIKSLIFTIKQLAEENDIFRVLVDTRDGTGFPGPIHILDFVKELPRTIKFAFLASEQQVTLQDILFTETAAHNRGFPLNVYKTRDEALAWLNS